jgi:hypothetical protein
MFTTLVLVAIVLSPFERGPCETDVAKLFARQLSLQEGFDLAEHAPRLRIVRIEPRQEVPGSFQRRFVAENEGRSLMLLGPGRSAPRGSGVGREQPSRCQCVDLHAMGGLKVLLRFLR